ncbi:cupin domain-containing protein [Halorientalis pallida]|uniref:cupin domain-containing protein n=1 Tax=Halorientalis pallida TaxID=2479928 RepID=UPI003C6FBB25
MPDREPYDVDAGLNKNLGAVLEVTPDETESGIAVVEHTLEPGKLAAPMHRHSHEDEISYIVEGTMGIQEGDQVSTAEAGEFAVKERGVWHTFWNPGPGPLRFLEIIAPGEFAGFFEETAAVLPEDGVPNEAEVAQLEELNEKYGLEMDPASVPELLERHGLEG